MVVYKSQPQFKVTTSYGSSNYTFENDQFINGRITRVENSFDIASLWVNDAQSLNWLNKMDAGSAITIEFKDASESTWTKEFDGVIRFITTPLSMSGEVLELKCDGKGFGFEDTVCGEEYGTESRNPALDTISKILEDLDKGIITKWVNKLLGTTAASGYSYGINLESGLTDSIKYIYFPFKPCSKSINDLLDIFQAIKGTNAGYHWIVDTNNYFRLKTINSDALSNWRKYYGASQGNATLEQGIDFTEFFFQKLTKEANYILYQGAFRYPGKGDLAENNASSWGVAGGGGLFNDGSISKVGSYSIKCTLPSGSGSWLEAYYPSGKNAAWNITTWGGRYNIPQINFWVRRDANLAPQVHVDFLSSANNCYHMRYLGNFSEANKWYYISIPIGSYVKESTVGDEIKIDIENSPNWANINWFEIEFVNANSAAGNAWFDGLHFSGTILRGAKESAGYSSTNPLKIKVITDDVAKDDSLLASDDSGTIARLAYAELLRCQTQPIIGWVKTPYLKDLKPGQFLHIHAKKKSDSGTCAICGAPGTFNIAKDMRASKVIHEFSTQGSLTTTEITDDLINANTRASWTDLNTIFKAQRPEFQDRQATSIKTREIDITQAILVTEY